MTRLHGKQYTKEEAHWHRVMRMLDRITPEAGDRLVFYAALFAVGFVIGLAVTGKL